MTWAAIVWIILAAAGLLLTANKHGQPREDYNFWVSFLSTGISVWILYWGGFFN